MFCVLVFCISETPSTTKLEETCGYPKTGGGWGKKQAEKFKEKRKKWDEDQAVETLQRIGEIT
jgi:hypothetical protein